MGRLTYEPVLVCLGSELLLCCCCCVVVVVVWVCVGGLDGNQSFL